MIMNKCMDINDVITTDVNTAEPAAVAEKSVIRYQRGGYSALQQDSVIDEAPVALEYNGVAYTVMMCTPQDLEWFAIGFSLSEGIIDHVRDIHDIDIAHHVSGSTISLTLANRCMARLKERRRSLAGVTGCGICGTEKLSKVVRDVARLNETTHFAIENLDDALIELQQQQALNALTGSCHAAGYLSPQGEIEALFEDVGRHIALDKLLGWACKHKKQGGAILVTSRASFEMVQKVAACGFEILLAVSAPTSMAIELAEQLNLTLCGYCRQGRANIYTHSQRLVAEHSDCDHGYHCAAEY